MSRRKSIDKKAVNQKILETDVETQIANMNKQTKAAKSKKYQLAADEFEETFGLNEYEEVAKKCKTDKDCGKKEDCCRGKCYGPDAEDRPDPPCDQEADFEFGKEEEYEEVVEPVSPPTSPGGWNKNKKLGGRSKKAQRYKGVIGSSRANIRAVRAMQGKSSNRNKGLTKAQEKKISSCVALGVKVDKRNGPPMYPHHDCTECCKKLNGQLNSLCNDRCNIYSKNTTTQNPMIANKIRKKKSSTEYQDLKF